MAQRTLRSQRATDTADVYIYNRIVLFTIHKIGDFVVKISRFLCFPSCIGYSASL